MKDLTVLLDLVKLVHGSSNLDGSTAVKLTFLGKDSTPDDSPTLYATDQDSYVVQGWIVTDPAILARHALPDDEEIVEIPPALLAFLANDGLKGSVTNPVPPIVEVTSNGSYIVRGKSVTDSEARGQMKIPDHESCVHVSKSSLAALLVGA
ncbi:MAG: hypothetical protein ACRDQ0_20590 [Pseudonocardia sp.]